MMGRRKRDQGKLFYEFRLEDRIPEKHLLRRINVFVTAALSDLHKELEPYYSEIVSDINAYESCASSGFLGQLSVFCKGVFGPSG